METIGKRIKRLREQRGWMIKDVAAKTGIPASTLREWEYGREIKGEPYVKIAEALGVTLYELMTGEIPEPAQVYEKIRLIEQHCEELKKALASFL